MPRTLGLVYPLAPFGCLMSFLQHPPLGLLPRASKDKDSGSDSAVPSRIKLSVMLDVTQGLQHLHKHGVVHGRLHSRNVLIGAGFRAKLVDFGVSHLVTPACAIGRCMCCALARGYCSERTAEHMFGRRDALPAYTALQDS